jgi:hypothetical protein
MDGVLAKWSNVSIEETYEKGFFSTRDPERVAIEVMKMMIQGGKDTSVLSQAYNDDHSVNDKDEWLGGNELGNVARIYVPYGEDKHKYLPEDEGNVLYVLIDDFTKNLFSWESAGKKFVGIKFMNGINGTHKTWDGYMVTNRMSAEKIFTAITSIAEAEAARRFTA